MFLLETDVLLTLNVEKEANGTDLQGFYLFTCLLYMQPVSLQALLRQSLWVGQETRERTWGGDVFNI